MPKLLLILLLACSLTACAGEIQLVRPIHQCVVNGTTYGVGAGNIPAIDGCNSCFCDAGGALVCTQKVCDLTNPGSPAAEPIEPQVWIATLSGSGSTTGTAELIAEGKNVKLKVATKNLPELNENQNLIVYLLRVEPFDAYEIGTLRLTEDRKSGTTELESTDTALVRYDRVVVKSQTGSDNYTNGELVLEGALTGKLR